MTATVVAFPDATIVAVPVTITDGDRTWRWACTTCRYLHQITYGSAREARRYGRHHTPTCPGPLEAA